MGSSFSKTTVSDPSKFATKASDAPEDAAKWKQYDYIIAGGGTAGCVMASRLSEDPNVTVLLIEAGKSEGNTFVQMPLAFTKTYRTELDWAYNPVPQESMSGRVIHWGRGKLLGGTSCVNASIYDRCAPDDFNHWANNGATGWSWKDPEPYFRKAEHYVPSRHPKGVNLEEKGKDGPWYVIQDEGAAPINDKLIEACQNVGMPLIKDHNSSSGPHLGIAHLHGNVDEKGTRSSTSTAYLTPSVLARPNLTVAVNTFVDKVIFSGSDAEGSLKAIGVQVAASTTSPKYQVGAKREVILTGGVVGSTQILLLSGVGPKEELEPVGVKPVKDLQHVGKHLTDHMSSGPFIFRVKPGYTLDYLNHSPLAAVQAVFKWLLWGSGPFSKMPVGAAAFARSDDAKFINTSIGEVKDLTTGPGVPDLELMWSPVIAPTYWDIGPKGAHGFTIASVCLQPESEGNIVLKTNSIFDKPIINGNYLSSETDVNVILRGVRLIQKIVHTEPVQSILDLKSDNADKSSYFWPGDADPAKVTDDELKAWIMRNGHTACHPAGTCRMGTSAENSVVDPSLQVHGIKGLRVVDASVFPKHVSGHPAAPIVAMAEKLSDMIKAQYASA